MANGRSAAPTIEASEMIRLTAMIAAPTAKTVRSASGATARLVSHEPAKARLGSDMGDRLGNLNHAVAAIASVAKVVECSSVYETEPVDMAGEDLFLNMVLGIETTDDPPLLLVKLRKIEKKMGRKPHRHRQPRIIDIDILLYRGMAYEDHLVRVPHAELTRRRFALEPLHEIAPMAVHPVMEKTVAWLLRNCHDGHMVRKTAETVTVGNTAVEGGPDERPLASASTPGDIATVTE